MENSQAGLTCSASLSFLRRESDSSGLRPVEAISLCAKWVNLYVSLSGFDEHCRTNHNQHVITKVTVLPHAAACFDTARKLDS